MDNYTIMLDVFALSLQEDVVAPSPVFDGSQNDHQWDHLDSSSVPTVDETLERLALVDQPRLGRAVVGGNNP